MSGKELKKFSQATTINAAGELTINAGKFTRGAVIAAYEMIGGLETFAEWAEENQSEFYTKMFGKIIGREVEHTVSDSVENLLDQLDSGILENAVIELAPADEITDLVPIASPTTVSKLKQMALLYAAGEDDEEAD